MGLRSWFSRPQKSVLFVRPDYHCSFFYRDELRKLGWKADIYVPWSYPEHLLYSDSDIVRPPRAPLLTGKLAQIANSVLGDFWFLTHGWRYKHHLYYGRPPEWFVVLGKLLPGRKATLSLRLANAWKTNLTYHPTGCHDEFSKAAFEQFDGGAVCGNCGAWDGCLDKGNFRNFGTVNKYFSLIIANDPSKSHQLPAAVHIRWKAIDPNLWKPELEIPPEHRLPETMNLRILHSFSSNGRDYKGRNIKGSPFVKSAVDRLIAEGHNVELLYVTDIASRDMRYYQAQADIVVEQLIYGWWGSTGVETMALGKPVVCYLRPAWKKFFLSVFPEYEVLPIIEADRESIYRVLKELVVDEDYRKRAGHSSRVFALKHFDPARNASALEAALLNVNKSTTCDPLTRLT